MPYTITKVKGGYRVKGPRGGLKSRKTTLKKAKAQVRLLNAVKHGWTPSRR